MFNVSPTTRDEAGALNSWVTVEGIDFWDSPRSAGQSGRVMVAPSIFANFEQFLKGSGINHELIIENVERYVSIKNIHLKLYLYINCICIAHFKMNVPKLMKKMLNC